MRTARVTLNSLQPGTAGGRTGWRILLLLSGAAAFGWVVAARPAIAALCVFALPGLLLLVSPRARVVLMAFGPIVFFGESADFTAQKQLFLLAAAAAFIGSFLRSYGLRHTFEYRTLRPLFVASTAFLMLGAMSLVVAELGGVPLTPWLRDVSPYMLFAAAPYFALDAATTLTARRLRLLLCVAGVLG
jgi:hypothetical protein